MFELPHGDAIDESFDGSAMNEIMDFECGVISTYKPKSRAPCAHRIIAGGRVVGWIAEAEEKKHGAPFYLKDLRDNSYIFFNSLFS